MANGDSMDDLVGDHGVLNSSLEPDVNLELEQLKLQHLKLQEEQLLCKQRMLLLKQTERKPSSSTRCIMPDGRIVVRSVQGDNDAENLGAGGGDATKIPGLQSSAVCVACGDRADSFCSGCRVTPYCSAACQRRDWLSRHKKVCHNLKRQSGDAGQSRPEPEPEPVAPAPAPLRRPRSPDSGRKDSGSDRMPPRRFGPPGSATVPTPVAAAARGGNRGSQGGQPADNRGRLNRSIDGDDGPNSRFNDRPRNDRDKNDGDRNDRPRNDQDRNDRPRNDRDRNDRPRNDGDRNDRPRNDRDRNDRPRHDGDRNDRDRNQDNRNSGYGRQRNQDGGNRQFTRSSGGADNRAPAQDEDWGPAPAKPQEPKPQAAQKAEPAARAKPAEPAPAPRLATVADVAPVPPRKLTPANCVVELLSEGETFLLSVDATGESCRAGPGFVCTTVLFAGQHADNYVQLIDPLKDACEAAEPAQPRPGDLFAYRDPSDEAWYRARCLGPGLAALLDASRLAEFTQKDRCSRLPSEFSNIPEYCCQLDCGKVKLTDTPECTVVSKSGGIVTLSLATESGAVTATARRWLPAADAAPAPAPAAAPKPAAAPAAAAAPAKAPAIVELPRPPVTNNSLVILMDATDPERVFVVPAHKDKLQEFNDIACEVAVYAADPKVPRLKELPAQGQTVIARFTDGMDYRAFVKRVSSKHKRCLLEYIEYGNIHIEDKLENMCACPPELDARARPTPASMVTLQMKPKSFTDAAKAYLDTLKEEAYELKLTIPSGAESGPTGTAVRLAIVKTGEDVNRKVETLSTPQWLLHLERGGDVLEIDSVHFNDIEYVDPTSGELVILDTSMLSTGCVYGHSREAAHARRALELTRMLEEYCNSELAKDPYLPKLEELCIAKCPKKNQWLRAVVLEQKGGPGAPTAELQFFDYGYLETVPVSSLRKMMPEFVRGVPAAVTSLEIKDFPANPTPEQISRAERHMRIAADGSGVLAATRVTRAQLGEYVIEAPDLIRAMQ